jgi:adenine deaminase
MAGRLAAAARPDMIGVSCSWDCAASSDRWTSIPITSRQSSTLRLARCALPNEWISARQRRRRRPFLDADPRPVAAESRRAKSVRHPNDFVVQAKGAQRIKVIEIVPNQIITQQALERPKVSDGQIISDTERDILKLVVVERHQATGNVGVGFVRGFGLQRGALASTVANDAHNVVVIGTNDTDIMAAIHALEEMRGGQVAVADGNIEAALPLPIAGLVSDQPLEIVMERIATLNAAAHSLGCKLAAPFMSLSFLSLSPIPALKLTDQGLVDAVNMKLTSLFED